MVTFILIEHLNKKIKFLWSADQCQMISHKSVAMVIIISSSFSNNSKINFFSKIKRIMNRLLSLFEKNENLCQKDKNKNYKTSTAS